jgi:hypothetical protein
MTEIIRRFLSKAADTKNAVSETVYNGCCRLKMFFSG